MTEPIYESNYYQEVDRIQESPIQNNTQNMLWFKETKYEEIEIENSSSNTFDKLARLVPPENDEMDFLNMEFL